MPEKELALNMAIYAFKGTYSSRCTTSRSHASIKSRFVSCVKQKITMNATLKLMVTYILLTWITILHSLLLTGSAYNS
jgi:hypothetical protein